MVKHRSKSRAELVGPVYYASSFWVQEMLWYLCNWLLEPLKDEKCYKIRYFFILIQRWLHQIYVKQHLSPPSVTNYILNATVNHFIPCSIPFYCYGTQLGIWQVPGAWCRKSWKLKHFADNKLEKNEENPLYLKHYCNSAGQLHVGTMENNSLCC